MCDGLLGKGEFQSSRSLDALLSDLVGRGPIWQKAMLGHLSIRDHAGNGPFRDEQDDLADGAFPVLVWSFCWNSAVSASLL